MDGAIILAADGSRVARANVHLVPDPDIPTSETGTRHRTAERVARQISVPVITISEEMGVVSVHYRGYKKTLEPIPRVLARGDQALQILGRYKERLDGVSGALSALEVEDLVTVRDVATVLQRAEMVRRIAKEIEGYVVELGVDGRLVELQLEELTGGVRADRRLVCKDYFIESSEWVLEQVTEPARRAERRGAARPAPRREPAAAPRRDGPRLVAAAARLPAAEQDPAAPRSDRGERRRNGSDSFRRSCGRRSRISSRSKASARRAPARSRTASRASRRRRSSTATRDRTLAGCSLSTRWLRSKKERSTTSPSSRGRSSSTASRSRSCTRVPTGCRGPASSCIPTSMGLRPLFDDMARRLATQRVRRCARVEPYAHVDREHWATVEARLAAASQLDDAVQLADLEAAADLLVVEDDVARVSVLGFCMGGYYTYKAAASDRFDAAVAFYGMLRTPEAWRGAGHGRDPLDLAARDVPDARDLRQRRSVDATGRHRGVARRVERPRRLRDHRRRRCGPRVRPRPRPPGAPRRRCRSALGARARLDRCRSGSRVELRARDRSARRGRGCGTGRGPRSRANRAGRTSRSPCSHVRATRRPFPPAPLGSTACGTRPRRRPARANASRCGR